MTTETVTIMGEQFRLELAIDPASRQVGLMRRDHIPEHGGMLFVFPDEQVQVQAFWMANCPIDMDVIFLDGRGYVTAVHRMKAEPPRQSDESESEYDRRLPRYSSGYPAQFAIELRAGTAERLGVKFERRIELEIGRLKGMAR